MMMISSHYMSNENNCSSDVVSSDVVSCHCVKWKVVEGVLEDWRCAPQYGAHILWGNDADKLQRTPIDYWKLSFPLQLLPDIVTWTTASLPAGCAKATEEEILAVFGILYSLTRTSDETFGPLRMVSSQHHDLVRDIPCHATALKFCYDVSHSVLKQWANH